MNSLLLGTARPWRAGLYCRRSNPRSSCASSPPRRLFVFAWRSRLPQTHVVRMVCTAISFSFATAYPRVLGPGSMTTPDLGSSLCMAWSARSLLVFAWCSPHAPMLRARNSTGERRVQLLLLLRPPPHSPSLFPLLRSEPSRSMMGLLPHLRLLPRRTIRGFARPPPLSLFLHLLPLPDHHPTPILLTSSHRLACLLAMRGTTRGSFFTPLPPQTLHRLPHIPPRPLLTTLPTCDRRLLPSHRFSLDPDSPPCLPPSRRLSQSIMRLLLPPVLKSWSRPCYHQHPFCLLAASLFLYGMRLGGGAGTASRAPMSIRLLSPLDMMCSILCFVGATRRRTSCLMRSVDPCETRHIHAASVRGSARPATAISFIRVDRRRDSVVTGLRGLLVAFSSRGCAARRAHAAHPTLILSR